MTSDNSTLRHVAAFFCAALLCRSIHAFGESTDKPSIVANTAVAAVPATDVLSPTEAAELSAMPLDKLLKKAHEAKDEKEQRKLARAIADRKPVNTKEIEILLNDLDNAGAFLERNVVRDAAGSALLKISNPAMGTLFVKKIKHSGIYARSACIKVLAKFKTKEAVPDLIDLVRDFGEQDKKKRDSNAVLKIEAAVALGVIGDERAIPVLISKLGMMNGDESKALAMFGMKALPRLMETSLHTKNDQASVAADNAIIYMRDKTAIPLMWKVVSGQIEGPRIPALRMLLNTCNASTSPSLEEVETYLFATCEKDDNFIYDAIRVARNKKDSDFILKIAQRENIRDGLRKWAIYTLGEMKASKAVPFLETLLKDSDSSIRQHASMALRRIANK